MKQSKYGLPFRTVSGKLIYPLDLESEDIDINDVAYALARLNRFGGHAEPAISVAEHCLRVSQKCPKKDALTGLLHDASEAFLVDMPRPIKAFMVEYKQFEEKAQRVICEKFGLTWPFPASVHTADHRMLATEQRDLMKGASLDGVKPYKEKIIPMTAKQAQRAFLKRYEELSNGKRRTG